MKYHAINSSRVRVSQELRVHYIVRHKTTALVVRPLYGPDGHCPRIIDARKVLVKLAVLEYRLAQQETKSIPCRLLHFVMCGGKRRAQEKLPPTHGNRLPAVRSVAVNGRSDERPTVVNWRYDDDIDAQPINQVATDLLSPIGAAKFRSSITGMPPWRRNGGLALTHGL